MSTPIIDYASPASRASLRLPARSEIRWNNAPGRLIITQVLSGREGAIGALLLAAFTFAIMTLSVQGMIGKWHRFVGEIGLMALFMAAELVVGALVIHNTWRKTILTVTPDEMTLEFTAPFTAREKFVFRSEQIAQVSVIDRPALAGEAVVPELEIRMWSIPSVRLFAGHPHSTLMTIASAIGHIQPLAPPPLPSANAQAATGLTRDAQAVDAQQPDARPAAWSRSAVMPVTPAAMAAVPQSPHAQSAPSVATPDEPDEQPVQPAHPPRPSTGFTVNL